MLLLGRERGRVLMTLLLLYLTLLLPGWPNLSDGLRVVRDFRCAVFLDEYNTDLCLATEACTAVEGNQIEVCEVHCIAN
jgi:hypothetical protein